MIAEKMTERTSFFESIYVYFLGRDLAYVVGGAIFIWAFMFAAFDKNILVQLQSVSNWIIYVVISYFIGLALSELAQYTKVHPKKLPKMKKVKDQKSFEYYYSQILRKGHPIRSINSYERTIVLMTYGQATGVASLCGVIVLAIFYVIRRSSGIAFSECNYLTAMIVSLAYGIWMFIYGKIKRREWGDRTEEFLELKQE